MVPARTTEVIRSGGERRIHITKVAGSISAAFTNKYLMGQVEEGGGSIPTGRTMKSLHIDKTKTALVVIDLQKGIVERPGAEPYEASSVVTNAAQLADAFRKNGMPVFLVRVTPSADLKDGLHPEVDALIERRQTTPDQSEIVPEIGPKEGDFVITKRQWGAFYGTELDLQLRRREITTIVLCGISTNIGVESTARDAYERGYHQIFAEDAMTARSKEGHNATVNLIFPRIGRVRSTEEILKKLSTNHSERSKGSHKQNDSITFQ